MLASRLNSSLPDHDDIEAIDLLLVLLLIIAITLLSGLGLLSPDTTGTSATEWRGQSEVDVLLGVETDNERGDVDDLLSNTDVALLNEDTGVVDGLGETELVDASLKTTLQEILNLQGQDVIELHAGLIKDTDTDETANEGIAFEETLGVLLIKSEELTVRMLETVEWCRLRRSYRAARRILERVSWTRHTSRLLRRPYSPTIFNSESLLRYG